MVGVDHVLVGVLRVVVIRHPLSPHVLRRLSRRHLGHLLVVHVVALGRRHLAVLHVRRHLVVALGRRRHLASSVGVLLRRHVPVWPSHLVLWPGPVRERGSRVWTAALPSFLPVVVIASLVVGRELSLLRTRTGGHWSLALGLSLAAALVLALRV